MSLTDPELHRPAVHVHATADAAARAAAARAAEAIVTAIEARGAARALFASAPSQEAMLAWLGDDPRIDWARVRSFHLDEYVGIAASAPQAFGQWLADRLPAAALPGFSRISADTQGEAEAQRYSALVTADQIDVTCMGIGVNGHVAFNEPGVSSLTDPEKARQVGLDLASRQQQVDEGLFSTLADVPTSAITLTVPSVISARSLVVTVLGEQKAPAVVRALEGPLSSDCPGSLLQAHPNVAWFLDEAAAARLTGDRTG